MRILILLVWVFSAFEALAIKTFEVGIDTNLEEAPTPKSIDLGEVETETVSELIYPTVQQKKDFEKAEFEKYFIQFKFNKNAPQVAAFRRANFLWIVLDSTVNFDFSLPYEIKKLKNNKATIFKIALPNYLYPIFKKDAQEVLLQFAKSDSLEKNMPRISYSEGLFEASFISSIKSVITFTDTDVGDNLFVVILKDSVQRLLNYENYPYFELLPSYTGLVVASKVDALKMSVADNGSKVIIRD